MTKQTIALGSTIVLLLAFNALLLLTPQGDRRASISTIARSSARQIIVAASHDFTPESEKPETFSLRTRTERYAEFASQGLSWHVLHASHEIWLVSRDRELLEATWTAETAPSGEYIRNNLSVLILVTDMSGTPSYWRVAWETRQVDSDGALQPEYALRIR